LISLVGIVVRTYTKVDPAKIKSLFKWGKAPCPPLPLIFMIILSHEAIIPLSRHISYPTFIPGVLCIPYTSSTFSKQPSSIILKAPCPISSAG